MNRAVSTPTFAPNSVLAGATRKAAMSPIETAYTIRPLALAGIVLGSVIMKNKNTRISGDDRVAPDHASGHAERGASG